MDDALTAGTLSGDAATTDSLLRDGPLILPRRGGSPSPGELLSAGGSPETLSLDDLSLGDPATASISLDPLSSSDGLTLDPLEPDEDPSIELGDPVDVDRWAPASPGAPARRARLPTDEQIRAHVPSASPQLPPAPSPGGTVDRDAETVERPGPAVSASHAVVPVSAPVVAAPLPPPSREPETLRVPTPPLLSARAPKGVPGVPPAPPGLGPSAGARLDAAATPGSFAPPPSIPPVAPPSVRDDGPPPGPADAAPPSSGVESPKAPPPVEAVAPPVSSRPGRARAVSEVSSDAEEVPLSPGPDPGAQAADVAAAEPPQPAGGAPSALSQATAAPSSPPAGGIPAELDPDAPPSARDRAPADPEPRPEPMSELDLAGAIEILGPWRLSGELVPWPVPRITPLEVLPGEWSPPLETGPHGTEDGLEVLDVDMSAESLEAALVGVMPQDPSLDDFLLDGSEEVVARPSSLELLADLDSIEEPGPGGMGDVHGDWLEAIVEPDGGQDAVEPLQAVPSAQSKRVPSHSLAGAIAPTEPLDEQPTHAVEGEILELALAALSAASTTTASPGPGGGAEIESASPSPVQSATGPSASSLEPAGDDDEPRDPFTFSRPALPRPSMGPEPTTDGPLERGAAASATVAAVAATLGRADARSGPIGLLLGDPRPFTLQPLGSLRLWLDFGAPAPGHPLASAELAGVELGASRAPEARHRPSAAPAAEVAAPLPPIAPEEPKVEAPVPSLPPARPSPAVARAEPPPAGSPSEEPTQGAGGRSRRRRRSGRQDTAPPSPRVPSLERKRAARRGNALISVPSDEPGPGAAEHQGVRSAEPQTASERPTERRPVPMPAAGRASRASGEAPSSTSTAGPSAVPPIASGRAAPSPPRAVVPEPLVPEAARIPASKGSKTSTSKGAKPAVAKASKPAAAKGSKTPVPKALKPAAAKASKPPAPKPAASKVPTPPASKGSKPPASKLPAGKGAKRSGSKPPGSKASRASTPQAEPPPGQRPPRASSARSEGPIRGAKAARPPAPDPRADEPTTEEPLLIELSQEGPAPRPPVALEISHADFSDEITAPVNVTDFVPELHLDDSSDAEGEPSVEHVLELDEDGDSLASLTLEMEGESDDAADVVAAGGAIRVELALGRPGALEPNEVKAGVAVAPAAPLRSWTARGGDPSEITTDLVALARISESSGALADPTKSPPVAPPVAPRVSDDWLDEIEEDDTEDA